MAHGTTFWGVRLLSLPLALLLSCPALSDEILQETVKKDVMTEADIAYATVAKVNTEQAAPASKKVTETETVVEEVKAPSATGLINRFSVTGVGGFMNPLQGGNLLKGRFSTGLTLGFDISEHVALEGSLIYSKYSVKPGYYGYVFGSHYYYDNRYNMPAAYGAYQSGASFTDMRQWLYGLDVLFRLFGRNVVTPLLGFGLSGIHNRYYGDPNPIGTFTYNNAYNQGAMALDGLAGLELNLTKNIALSGRFKIYSQLTNRSHYNAFHAQTGGSNNEFYQVLGGLSLRL